jgi:signal transduction histidine kinase
MISKNTLNHSDLLVEAKSQGLGLAVVNRLVEALGGSISFENQAGQGKEQYSP